MKETEIPYGYIYRIINKLNQKTYIGKRKLTLDKSWRQYMGSGRNIKHAILKYGKNSFVKELVSYAYSSNELSMLESFYINEEVQKGKSEYNIFATPYESINKKSKDLLSEYPILDWYFIDNMSTHEISKMINFSQPLVLSYIKESGDPRVENIRNRTSLKKKERNGSWIKTRNQIICTMCNEMFLPNRKNQIYCSKNCVYKIKKNFINNVWSEERKKNISKAMVKNKNALGNKGGVITSHQRWHAKRGIVSPLCNLCNNTI